MITGDSTAETAIRALNEGADAYITKPLKTEYVVHSLEQIMERQKLREDNILLNRKLQQELGEKNPCRGNPYRQFEFYSETDRYLSQSHLL